MRARRDERAAGLRRRVERWHLQHAGEVRAQAEPRAAHRRRGAQQRTDAVAVADGAAGDVDVHPGARARAPDRVRPARGRDPGRLAADRIGRSATRRNDEHAVGVRRDARRPRGAARCDAPTDRRRLPTRTRARAGGVSAPRSLRHSVDAFAHAVVGHVAEAAQRERGADGAEARRQRARPLRRARSSSRRSPRRPPARPRASRRTRPRSRCAPARRTSSDRTRHARRRARSCPRSGDRSDLRADRSSRPQRHAACAVGPVEGLGRRVEVGRRLDGARPAQRVDLPGHRVGAVPVRDRGRAVRADGDARVAAAGRPTGRASRSPTSRASRRPTAPPSKYAPARRSSPWSHVAVAARGRARRRPRRSRRRRATRRPAAAGRCGPGTAARRRAPTPRDAEHLEHGVAQDDVVRRRDRRAGEANRERRAEARAEGELPLPRRAPRRWARAAAGATRCSGGTAARRRARGRSHRAPASAYRGAARRR